LEGTATEATQFAVQEADCLDAAERLLGEGLNPCVLNMASGRTPGGGVLRGSSAQEESLFRRTNLFVSLYQFAPYASKYGLERSKDHYPLPEAGSVYSENVTVFRRSEKQGCAFLERPFKVGIVSVAAISHPSLERQEGRLRLSAPDASLTQEKIRSILRTSALHKHDALVLSAFGCGAYANPPEHIAELFRQVFAEKEFVGRFKKIVFAIFDDANSRKEHNPEGNLRPFERVFGGKSPPPTSAPARHTNSPSKPPRLQKSAAPK
jgi:uncharacterized protein (TIGR02452 family)